MLKVNKPKKFTHKPSEVEAMQYQGKNEMDVRNFCSAIQPGRAFGDVLVLDSDVGQQIVDLGCWVVKDSEGRFWVQDLISFGKDYE